MERMGAGARSEVGGPRSEGRGPKSEDGGRMTEDGGRRAKGGGGQYPISNRTISNIQVGAGGRSDRGDEAGKQDRTGKQEKEEGAGIAHIQIQYPISKGGGGGARSEVGSPRSDDCPTTTD